MSTINDLPADVPWGSGFGEGFNYAAWTANTTVELCNVPWNNDYRDIVEFASTDALDAYLNGVSGPKFTLTQLTLARAGEPVRVNLPFNQCYQFNYLRVTNGAQPIPTYSNGVLTGTTDFVKPLYYFITDVRYIAPNTTELSIQLDVWQTFGHDVTFGQCYVERGHIGVANSNRMTNQGREYLTQPEGLDIGSEYAILKVDQVALEANPNPTTDGVSDTTAPWVIMGIGVDITADPGDVTAPNLAMNDALQNPNTDGLPNGFDVLIFTNLNDYVLFLAAYREKPWVLQSIQFVTMIPPVFIPDSYWDEFGGSQMHKVTGLPSSLSLVDIWRLNNGTAIRHLFTIGDSVWRDNIRDLGMGTRYQHLDKFLTYPYAIVELTTNNGSPLILKPELVPGLNMSLEVIQQVAPPAPRFAIAVTDYNGKIDGSIPTDENGEWMDFAMILTNFPQFTILNNSYLNYLASNRNQIAYQFTAADWAQQKALTGAQTAAAQAGVSIGAAGDMANLGTSINNASTSLNNRVAAANGLQAGANALIGGAASRNPAAAAAGIGNAINNVVIGNTARSAQNAINNTALQQSTMIGQGVQRFNRDTNLQYANYAANGDYGNAINGINAKLQDAKMLQPTTVGQLGGDAFIPAVFGQYRVYMKIKGLTQGMYRVIGEFWLRYGYAINLFIQMPASKHCMSKFTYWKLRETYITSSRCPELYRQTIRGIFEKGVTVWVNPADIGNIDIGTNVPLGGISY